MRLFDWSLQHNQEPFKNMIGVLRRNKTWTFGMLYILLQTFFSFIHRVEKPVIYIQNREQITYSKNRGVVYYLP